MTRCGQLAVVTTLLIVCVGATEAQTPDPLPLGPASDPARPALSPFPEREDWSFLRNPAKQADHYDRLKFIPFNRTGTNYFTLGLENRIEYEFLDGANWGKGPQDPNGYVLERLMPDVDLRIGDHVRLYTSLKFNEIGGKVGGPRPTLDKDLADVHEAFLDVGQHLHAKESGANLRIGRQELVFGTGRLVDDNEGVNVRFSFDGIRANWDTSRLQLSAFAVKPVEINPGTFDDSPDHQRSFWGLYATAPVPVLPGNRIDLYYFGLDQKHAVYEQGTGREIRHSVGTRWFNRAPGTPPQRGVDYNWEAVYQWGAFGPNSIRAWTVASETGYTFSGQPWRARILLRVDAASGDGNAHDHTLGTFNPLFPRGAYFAPKLVLAGPINFIDLHPAVQLHPLQNVTASLEWVWFWRESTTDGIYSPSGVELRPPAPGEDRFIGSQPNVEVRWAVTPHVTAAFNVAGFFVGSVLKQTPPASNVAFSNVGLVYRF